MKKTANNGSKFTTYTTNMHAVGSKMANMAAPRSSKSADQSTKRLGGAMKSKRGK